MFCFVLFLLFAFYYYSFFFFFFFFFLIIQSQAAFVNCLYVARFTIVHSKTQIKFPLLLLSGFTYIIIIVITVIIIIMIIIIIKHQKSMYAVSLYAGICANPQKGA